MKAPMIEMTEVRLMNCHNYIELFSYSQLFLFSCEHVAIRVAVKWYSNHLPKGTTEVVMLSDDRDNREKAKSAAIKCSSVRDYVTGLTETPELMDMVVTAQEATEAHAKADGKVTYEEVMEKRCYDGSSLNANGYLLSVSFCST